MKKTTTTMAMASPCPYQTKKRPMSRAERPASNLKAVLILFICLGFALSPAFAQPPAQNQTNYLLKGRITTSDGSPLPGATISEKGTQNSAQSTSDGTFQLKTMAPKGKLTVTYLGYQAKETDFDTGTPVTIVLAEDAATLKAIEINTGYYSVKRKQLTGSISSVKAEAIEKQPISNPVLALQGRTTGAYITQSTSVPGGQVSVIIRGQNGIETSTSPLYLIDGIPYSSTSMTNTFSAALYNVAGASPLSSISPDDIASIDILKDADATAIYGSRGANGVVLITTKKGKAGKTSSSFSAQTGTSSATRQIQMLDTEDYLALRKLAIALDNTTIKTTDYDLNGAWDQNAYTDWQKQLLGNSATFSNYRISLSGGSPQTTFLFSAGHNRQGTIYPGELGYNRTSAHLSGSHTSADQKLKASASAQYTIDNTNWINSDITSRALNLQPNAPVLYDTDGKLNWANGTFVNPLRNLENGYRGKTGTLVTSANLSYSPLKNLELRTNLGYNTTQLSDRSYVPVSYYDPAEARTSATSTSDYGSSKQESITSELQASYSLNIKSHKISLLAGGTYQQQRRESIYLRGTGFASDALLSSIASATTTTLSGAGSSTYRYAGVYGRINYTLKERYILNLTARRDASSRFGTGRKTGSFGAVGAAYLFSEENFIKQNLPQLSFGKLRISYGSAGNDQIGDYEYLNTYAPGVGYNNQTGLSPVRLFNPDFGWEKNRKLEMGMELGLFKDRINLALAHYRNLSTNQLISYPLASTAGFTSIRANLDAKVRNTGWEIELTSRNIKTKSFTWNTSFNITIPKNTLVAFPGLSTSSYANAYVIGRPLTVSKLYELKGVDPTTGIYTFTDYDGNGIINASDRQFIVDKGQRFYGGIDNSLTYKSFQLSFLFQFVKQTSGNFANQYLNAPGRSFNQPQAYQGKYWTKPGDIAELQRPSTGTLTAANSAQTAYQSSSAVVGDASFIRLKNISLSYSTDKLIRGRNIRASINAQNLVTITNYFGLDPESANSSLPLLKTITAGITLDL